MSQSSSRTLVIEEETVTLVALKKDLEYLILRVEKLDKAGDIRSQRISEIVTSCSSCQARIAEKMKAIDEITETMDGIKKELESSKIETEKRFHQIDMTFASINPVITITKWIGGVIAGFLLTLILALLTGQVTIQVGTALPIP